MPRRYNIQIRRSEPKIIYERLDMRPRIFKFTKIGKEHLASRGYSESEISMRIATYRGTLEEAIAQIGVEYDLTNRIHYVFGKRELKTRKVARRRWNSKLFD